MLTERRESQRPQGRCGCIIAPRMHRRLIRLTESSRFALAVGIACGALAGLCSLAQAYVLSATVDGVFLGRQDLAQVWPWLRLLFGVMLARGLLLCLQEVAAAEVAVRIKQNLRERLLGAPAPARAILCPRGANRRTDLNRGGRD